MGRLQLATVRESLLFSAELRLPPSVTRSQREAFVDELLDLLELKPLAGRLVGTPNADGALSANEMKRVSIGVELAANAPILFLDEPTSGLDARGAELVMRVIRRIASSGRTVLATLHVPSLAVISMADRMLLLQKGGYPVYFGPVGAGGRGVVDFLAEAAAGGPPGSGATAEAASVDSAAVVVAAEASGGTAQRKAGPTIPYFLLYPEEERPNPASYMLDALAAENEAQSQAQAQGQGQASTSGSSSGSAIPAGGLFSAYWRSCARATQLDAELASLRARAGTGNTSAGSGSSTAISAQAGGATGSTGGRSSSFSRSLPSQLRIVLRRSWLSHWRNLPYNMARLLTLVFLALLL